MAAALGANTKVQCPTSTPTFLARSDYKNGRSMKLFPTLESIPTIVIRVVKAGTALIQMERRAEPLASHIGFHGRRGSGCNPRSDRYRHTSFDLCAAPI